MDPETKELLKESLEISKQNNEMLKKMVRNQKWTNIYRVFYWGIIIFSSVGAYYFIEPYLANMLNVYSGGVSDTGTMGNVMSNLSNKQQFEDLLKTFKNQ